MNLTQTGRELPFSVNNQTGRKFSFSARKIPTVRTGAQAGTDSDRCCHAACYERGNLVYRFCPRHRDH